MNGDVQSRDLPPSHVEQRVYRVPEIEIETGDVSLALISEAGASEAGGHRYGQGDPVFERNPILAFTDAGVDLSSVRDLLGLHAWLTTAVK